jgi:hypothetical protein
MSTTSGENTQVMLTQYENRPDEPSPAESPESTMPPELPARIKAAIQLIAITNDYETACAWPRGFGRMLVRKPQAPVCQKDAMLRACLCLSRYFDGNNIDQPPEYFVPDDPVTVEFARLEGKAAAE